MEIYFQEKDTGRRSAMWENFPNPALAYRALCQLPKELYLSHTTAKAFISIQAGKLPEINCRRSWRLSIRGEHLTMTTADISGIGEQLLES